MTRIKLNWKKEKPTGPVYLEEAAQLLDTPYEALRARLYRMLNGAQDTLPATKQEDHGHKRRYWERDEFIAFVATKKQLDKIVQNSRK